jgi:hypothetical protein
MGEVFLFLVPRSPRRIFDSLFLVFGSSFLVLGNANREI